MRSTRAIGKKPAQIGLEKLAIAGAVGVVDGGGRGIGCDGIERIDGKKRFFRAGPGRKRQE